MYLESNQAAPFTAAATDTLSPAQVLGLTYTVQQGKVILTWNPVTTNSDATALADLSGYRVYRKNTAGDTFAVIATVASTVAAQVTTYEDISMLDGASYIYAVSAIDNEVTPNEGMLSADLAIKTIPSVPVNVAATTGDATIRLTWDAVTNVGVPKKNENLSGYRIYRKPSADGGAHVFLVQVAAGVNLHDDTTAVNNTNYSYTVTAIDNTL